MFECLSFPWKFVMKNMEYFFCYFVCCRCRWAYTCLYFFFFSIFHFLPRAFRIFLIIINCVSLVFIINVYYNFPSTLISGWNENDNNTETRVSVCNVLQLYISGVNGKHFFFRGKSEMWREQKLDERTERNGMERYMDCGLWIEMKKGSVKDLIKISISESCSLQLK